MCSLQLKKALFLHTHAWRYRNIALLISTIYTHTWNEGRNDSLHSPGEGVGVGVGNVTNDDTAETPTSAHVIIILKNFSQSSSQFSFFFLGQKIAIDSLHSPSDGVGVGVENTIDVGNTTNDDAAETPTRAHVQIITII